MTELPLTTDIDHDIEVWTRVIVDKDPPPDHIEWAIHQFAEWHEVPVVPTFIHFAWRVTIERVARGRIN